MCRLVTTFLGRLEYSRCSNQHESTCSLVHLKSSHQIFLRWSLTSPSFPVCTHRAPVELVSDVLMLPRSRYFAFIAEPGTCRYISLVSGDLGAGAFPIARSESGSALNCFENYLCSVLSCPWPRHPVDLPSLISVGTGLQDWWCEARRGIARTP